MKLFSYSFTTLAEWLGLFSLATFLISLLAIPLLIARLSADYFLTHEKLVHERHKRHPAIALAILIIRNSLGAILLLAGIAMLILPGQGLLTIIIAISLIDVPGKQKMLNQIIRRHSIQQALNWIRHKTGHEPFRFP